MKITKYIDRNLANGEVDYYNTLTNDGSWHSVDLSGIIKDKRAIMVNLQVVVGPLDASFELRKDSESCVYPVIDQIGHSSGWCAYIFCPIKKQSLEYNISNGAMHILRVLGWTIEIDIKCTKFGQVLYGE